MKLTYRTINYEAQQFPLDIVESELGGKYRGNTWQVRYPRHIPVPFESPSLKYRGVSYQSQNLVTLTQPQAFCEIQPEAPSKHLTTVHTANICRILEHRRQVAEAHGDEQLLKMLESEAQQLAC
ncbi:MAG: DUF4278 domain-containing protein [Cyanobacteria bacterium J06592_8]